MKKLIITSVFSLIALASNAQDSCYVYTQLHWAPAITKYVAQIQLNENGRDDDIDIADENGKKLSFRNILHALNYLSTKGWELVELGKKNPDNNAFVKEQYALIRKRMSIEEAKKYSTPKVK